MESVGLASSSQASVDMDQIDPWGVEEDDEHSLGTQSPDLQREWEARRLQFHSLGYRDGITAGNNSSVQVGFNAGFKEAISRGYNWGVTRGASSAYAALPSSLKELLLKDLEARNRLEALHSTISSISSAGAMGIYYKDSILQKGVTAEDSVQSHSGEESEKKSSVPTLREEDRTIVDQAEAGDTSNACCGEGSCGASTACSSRGGDGVPINAGESKLDGFSPQSAGISTLEDKCGTVSKEAHDFVLSVSSSSADTRQLEDSTSSHLLSLALGDPVLSVSTTRAAESSSQLEQYQRIVEAEFEQSGVKLPILLQS